MSFQIENLIGYPNLYAELAEDEILKTDEKAFALRACVKATLNHENFPWQETEQPGNHTRFVAELASDNRMLYGWPYKTARPRTA
jgi:hypothetical protein